MTTHTALFATISTNGHIWAINYVSDNQAQVYAHGSSAEVFIGEKKDTPLVDFRTADIELLLTEVYEKCYGPEGVNVIPGKIYFPMDAFLQCCQNAGATITTVGEILKSEGGSHE